MLWMHALHALDARSTRSGCTLRKLLRKLRKLRKLQTPDLAPKLGPPHPSHHPTHGLSILERSLRYSGLDAAAKDALTAAARQHTAPLALKLD